MIGDPDLSVGSLNDDDGGSSTYAPFSEEMVQRGMRALHEISTYRGYNQETLDREWSRMERIYRAQVIAILTAALLDRK